MTKAQITNDGMLLFHCPGCDQTHGVSTIGNGWQWNGSVESPSLMPSVFVHGHEVSPPFKPQPDCHSFVRDGKIQFLHDCTHPLKGQIVEIPEWEE